MLSARRGWFGGSWRLLGLIEGLPIALEFLGRPFSEPTLLKLAYAYEQASHKRVAPKSTPHLAGEVFTISVRSAWA